MKQILQFLVGMAVCQLSCFSFADSPSIRYHIIPIPIPEGYQVCTPTAVNDNGVVIGNALHNGYVQGDLMESFVFSGGKTAVFINPPFCAINNKNTILGREGKLGDSATATFDLLGNPTVVAGCPEMWPTLITDTGLIAGSSIGKQISETSSALPFTFYQGKVQWFPVPEGYTGGEIKAANSAGTVFYGDVWSNDEILKPERAVTWSTGKVMFLQLPPAPHDESTGAASLLTLGATQFIGVDGRGDALCSTLFTPEAGDTKQVFYLVNGDQVSPVVSSLEDGRHRSLTPRAISDSGVIVGSMGPSTTGAYVELNGKAGNLDKLIDQPGWIFDGARAISSDGKIAGTGLFNGRWSAYLLVPE